MVEEIGIVQGDFGKTYEFILKNRDYTGYTGKIFFQRSGGGMLYSTGDTVTLAHIDNDKNTKISYIVPSGRFGVSASMGKYYCQIEIKNGTALIDTLTGVMMTVDKNRKKSP
jgi:hypothetical protein